MLVKGTECFSTSTDGYVLWWDIRKIGEPTETMKLDVSKVGRKVLGGVALEYEPTIVSTYLSVWYRHDPSN